MNPWRTLALIVAVFLALPASAQVHTILSCDFDAEPLDQEIGTGGAALGQPVDLGGVPAFVRSAPLASPSLELTDDWDTGARTVDFEFLNDHEVLTGIVEVSMTLWFSELGNYTIALREHGSSTTSFTTIRFQQSGQIRYSDSDTAGAAQIGTYTVATPYALRIVFDLDQGRYGIDVDGTPLLADETWAPTARGIGTLLVGHDHDFDATGVFSVDDIVVMATESPSPVDGASWGRVKSLHRR